MFTIYLPYICQGYSAGGAHSSPDLCFGHAAVLGPVCARFRRKNDVVVVFYPRFNAKRYEFIKDK